MLGIRDPYFSSPVAVKSEPDSFDFVEDHVGRSVQLKTYANLSSMSKVKQEPVSAFDSPFSRPYTERSPPAMSHVERSPLLSPYIANSPAARSYTEVLSSPALVSGRETFTCSEESFEDSNIGGVAIAPSHGSVSTNVFV